MQIERSAIVSGICRKSGNLRLTIPNVGPLYPITVSIIEIKKIAIAISRTAQTRYCCQWRWSGCVECSNTLFLFPYLSSKMSFTLILKDTTCTRKCWKDTSYKWGTIFQFMEQVDILVFRKLPSARASQVPLS